MKLVCIDRTRCGHKISKLEIGKIYKVYVPTTKRTYNNTWDDTYTYIYVMIDGNPFPCPKSCFQTIEEYRQSRLKLIYE